MQNHQVSGGIPGGTSKEKVFAGKKWKLISLDQSSPYSGGDCFYCKVIKKRKVVHQCINGPAEGNKRPSQSLYEDFFFKLRVEDVSHLYLSPVGYNGRQRRDNSDEDEQAEVGKPSGQPSCDDDDKTPSATASFPSSSCTTIPISTVIVAGEENFVTSSYEKIQEGQCYFFLGSRSQWTGSARFQQSLGETFTQELQGNVRSTTVGDVSKKVTVSWPIVTPIQQYESNFKPEENDYRHLWDEEVSSGFSSGMMAKNILRRFNGAVSETLPAFVNVPSPTKRGRDPDQGAQE